MNSKTRTRIIALALFAALAIPVQLAAQGHARYKLIDIGTFGGPASDLNNGNDGSFSAEANGLKVGPRITVGTSPLSPNTRRRDYQANKEKCA